MFTHPSESAIIVRRLRDRGIGGAHHLTRCPSAKRQTFRVEFDIAAQGVLYEKLPGERDVNRWSLVQLLADLEDVVE
jgi:hypothetical protein